MANLAIGIKYNIMKIKAVFFDIDGTLISFKTHTIPQSTLQAIRQLKEKGIKIVVATGRSFNQISQLDTIAFDGYITFNGNVCLTADKEIFFKNSIPKETIQALIKYQEDVKMFPCVFMSEKENTINYVDDTVIRSFKILNLPVNEVKDMREAAKNDIIQLNVFLDPSEDTDLMQTALRNCEATRWTDLFADVNVKNTNKSTGVEKFLQHWNIDVSETLSFGDGGNDVAMLQYTGIGVAMGDASDSIKAIADYTTDSVDEDGIWNALKHFEVI
jgi:Cof subfamily protein (haloacid dehalogenase superfamily)